MFKRLFSLKSTKQAIRDFVEVEYKKESSDVKDQMVRDLLCRAVKC